MTLALVAVAVVLLALGVELLFRAVGHLGSEPLWWHDVVTQRKELAMRRLARRGPVDVVVIGTSMMLYGADPVALGRRLGVRCYNASLFRGLPTVTEAWLRDMVMPVLRPRLVVVSLSPVEANDVSPLITRYEEYKAAPLFHAGPLRRGWIAAARRSYAALYAPMLARPKALARLVLKALRQPSTWRWRVPLEIPGKVGELGEGTDMLDRSHRVMPKMGELVRQHVGEGYVTGGPQHEAWARMPDLVRSFGAEVVFAATPQPRSMLEGVFSGGPERFERERVRLQELADRTGTTVIDVTDGLDDEVFFADPFHCNRLGRDTWTARLADALTPYVAALPPISSGGTGQASTGGHRA